MTAGNDKPGIIFISIHLSRWEQKEKKFQW
jgi:hypothetical protein